MEDVMQLNERISEQQYRNRTCGFPRTFSLFVIYLNKQLAEITLSRCMILKGYISMKSMCYRCSGVKETFMLK
jgi:hypothetical protein